MKLLSNIRSIAIACQLYQTIVFAHSWHATHYHHFPKLSKHSVVTTADTEHLQTWWHSTGEYNKWTPVADENVRQSSVYSVQVSTEQNSTFFDSFVYASIPRSGKGKLCYPDQTDICSEDDQITIESNIGVTMSWSQFLYASNAVVKVTRLDGRTVSAANITIRPTNRHFNVTAEGNIAYITVPYTPDTNGARFSVEFADDIFEYRTRDLENQSSYVQDVNSTGESYVDSYMDSMPIVGREPLNSLLIFASPFPASDMIPSNDVFEVEPGLVESLEHVTESAVSFGPGVYWFTGKNHAILSPSVSWVYLAPGAYVKGAIEYNNGQSVLKATGFGVLSGEQYVYQANFDDGYSNNKSDTTSLKMWSAYGVTANQSWTMNGITTNAQPFNCMDFYSSNGNGPPTGFTIDVSDYKQVGAFYGQTDGLEMYTNSQLRDIFYHSGDDTIKTYYSGVSAERIIVWKTNNAPVIQLGWYPRTLDNVHISHVDVIHSRYYSVLTYAPRALIGSAASYINDESTSTADVNARISNYTVSHIRSEGISPALIGLNMLSAIQNFTIDTAWIEDFTPIPDLATSTVVGFTDPSDDDSMVAMGGLNSGDVGITITGYSVGDKVVTFDNDNWMADKTGKLNFEEAYWGKWTVQ